MPSSKKPAISLAKSVAKKPVAEKPLKAGKTPASKTSAAASKSAPATKVKTVPTKTTTLDDPKKVAAPAAKKVGRPPKAAGAAAPATGAKRGRKPKAGNDAPESDVDLSDIEEDLAGDEPAVATTTEEKVKPLRMKISKAKERALMKEFGLDETVLSEEEDRKSVV